MEERTAGFTSSARSRRHDVLSIPFLTSQPVEQASTAASPVSSTSTPNFSILETVSYTSSPKSQTEASSSSPPSPAPPSPSPKTYNIYRVFFHPSSRSPQSETLHSPTFHTAIAVVPFSLQAQNIGDMYFAAGNHTTGWSRGSRLSCAFEQTMPPPSSVRGRFSHKELAVSEVAESEMVLFKEVCAGVKLPERSLWREDDAGDYVEHVLMRFSSEVEVKRWFERGRKESG